VAGGENAGLTSRPSGLLRSRTAPSLRTAGENAAVGRFHRFGTSPQTIAVAAPTDASGSAADAALV